MYLSRVKVLADRPDKLIEVLQANHYQLHQLLWKLFPNDSEKKPRDFLFRKDDSGHLPMFYLLSVTQPEPLAGVLSVESKDYHPQLQVGDKLAFSLRANPVEQFSKARTPEEEAVLREQRQAKGLREKAILPQKRIHHDVVMHLKKSLTDAEKRAYSQAELEQQAGEQWLQERAEKNGFRVLSVTAQGYRQHHFQKRRIKISTLDYDGVLQVTEPEKFQQALFQGIGRAKAFGCGLLMIRRV